MAKFPPIVDFTGGMDLKSSDINLSPNSYRYLINGRTRFGYPEPIKDSVILAGPTGKKQGLYAFNTILVLFCNGNAYYQLLGQFGWTQIIGFVMDSAVNYIYALPVSSSTLNNQRQLSTANDITGGINISQQFLLSGNPAGLLCQDGKNQPWVIFYDPVSNTARARMTQNYTQWSNDYSAGGIAEYVPIGTLMFTFGAITFILSTDGFTLYRSVSGRPLDFMVNIDTNGNKLPSESLGGAHSVSFACSSEPVTYIGPLDPSDFMVATERNIFEVSLNTTDTLFGEPTFNTPLFLNTGIVNQFSVTDILSDLAFIDFDGPKVIGGVQQLKFAGRNDPFYLKISSILVDTTNPEKQPILQQVCCATTFNDYAIFSIKTNLGYLLAIYDCLPNELLQNKFDYSIQQRGKWTSLDITGAVQVKMFAISNDITNNRLFCITQNDQIFELFASEDSVVSQLKTSSLVNQDMAKHSSIGMNILFDMPVQLNTVQVTEEVDGKRGKVGTVSNGYQNNGISFPMYFPISFNTNKTAYNAYFNFRQGEEGTKLSYIISWDSSARILGLQIETTGRMHLLSKEQIASSLTQIMTENPVPPKQ